MFEFIEGAFEELTPSYIVVNTNGIGFRIEISLTSYAELKAKSKGRVFLHQIIREDAHVLYGFASTKERALFKELISVNGVGPNTARMMLSSLNPDELVRAVVNEDIASIKAIKGIGLKTAQRIVVDLKDGLSKFEIAETVIPNNNKNREEALLALQTLGFNKLLIEKTVDKILKEGVDYSVEELIRLALKVL
jgi:Holliday junction DNA helicase RuvA